MTFNVNGHEKIEINNHDVSQDSMNMSNSNYEVDSQISDKKRQKSSKLRVVVRPKKSQHNNNSSNVKVKLPDNEVKVKEEVNTRESERIERMKLIPYGGAVGQ